MAQNITLLGASYSAVPAVVLPKTGGGTARFDDASITTATASDVASGKVFLASDGTITTGTSSGGGGLDMPTFTVTWNADYTQVLSITCDKTYSEVYDYINTGKAVAIVLETDGEYTSERTAYFEDYDNFPSDSIKYFVYINAIDLSYDIVYTDNGTLTAISPSSYYEALNVTANGTYAPTTDYNIINEVNVSVPSTTISPLSVTANGTYTAPSGTAYSPVTVNVSGSGGASNVVTGTFKGTTTGAAMDITLNYSGSGYPIAAAIYPSGGTRGNDTFNTLVQRYASAMFCITKANANQTPAYARHTSVDEYVVLDRYKSSSSSSASYSQAGGQVYITTGLDSTSSNTAIMSFKSKTKMSVYIASTSYGFAANIEYTYHVIYSS